jgi:hypothetical protein
MSTADRKRRFWPAVTDFAEDVTLL